MKSALKKIPHPRSVPGVAARVGVCPATIYNEVKRGRLRVTKIGARTIITPEDEAAWLALGQVAAEDAA